MKSKRLSIKYVPVLLVCLWLLFSLSACSDTPTAPNCGYTGVCKGVRFQLPDLGAEVNLHSPLQTEFLAEATESGSYDCVLSYAQGLAEESRPVPVTLYWTAEAKAPIDEYAVCIAESPTMDDPFCTVRTTQSRLEVYHLKIGTTYYWQVSAITAGKTVTSGIACFTTTSQGPRNLYIDGVTNARDIGGYATADGRVRQGMIYRCGRMNTSFDPTPTVEITDEGLRWMTDVFGVRSEIDLRSFEESGQLTASPLGNGVQYQHFPMDYHGDMLTGNMEQIQALFAFLAKEENYPVVIHCNIGTDRTGTVAFLINGLCGVSENDLALDYAFSNFGFIESGRSVSLFLNTYLTAVTQAEGDTLSQQIYNYLAANGVSPADMDAVIDIMTRP